MSTLRHYVCGSTSHDVGALFYGAPHEVREFPAGAFLYDNARGQRVLFDTGYATGEWKAGWRGAAYRKLLPPSVHADDDIAAQLHADGVDPASVTHVVLSHLHPDHVGGLRRFPDAVLVVTDGTVRTAARAGLRSGVIPGLFASAFEGARRHVLTASSFHRTAVKNHTLDTADLLGDGSYRIVDLPGHTDGHVGALIEGRVLLAGDAAWGIDLLSASARLKRLPRSVQHNAKAYAHTAATLSELAASGLRIVCSHDPLREKDLLA